jgi:predicted transposase YbfD/YdcC
MRMKSFHVIMSKNMGRNCESPVERHWVESEVLEWVQDPDERESSPEHDGEDDEQEDEPMNKSDNQEDEPTDELDEPTDELDEY